VILPSVGLALILGIAAALSACSGPAEQQGPDPAAEQQAIRDAALSPLVAPCCDEYPASTCCCECNLSRSVWGLSDYLITEKGYGVDQVQEAALQWLHFIRPDYYVASELEQKGIDPGLWGLTTESTCFTNNCERPFYTKISSGYAGGCGGMDELIQG
jgi:hypothetical protein